MREIIEEFAPLLGEVAGHSLTRDPRIAAVSEEHYREVSELLDRHGAPGQPQPTQILEVGSYAHLTGHLLASRRGARVTLFDISAKALALGQKLAGGSPDADNPVLVMGDYHDLPFEDESFDLVYICSALHHTLRWTEPLAELQRVLNAGGLLLVSNEPCRRACCHYGFRTNREERFTPFERKLESLGVLRTFAEPYLGSRPETLFGMTENQQIPLDELLGRLDGPTEILEATFMPELCMGWLETQWVMLRDLGARELGNIISGDLRAARRQALAARDERQAALGFDLPAEDAIDRLAERAAQMICSLPSPEQAPRAYRQGLAEVFGAAVRVVARKRGARTHPSSGRMKKTYPRFDGVAHTLEGDLGLMLRPGGSQLPDVQTATEEELRAVFPAEQWRRVVTDGLTAMHLRAQPGVLRLPAGGGDRILILRFHCTPPANGPAIVTLGRQGEQLFVHQCWLQEGFLCAVRLPGDGGGDRLTVRCRAERDDAAAPPEAGLSIAVAGLFELAPPPPAFRVRRIDSFAQHERHLAAAAASHEQRRQYEQSLVDGPDFTVAGHCHPCGRTVDLQVDLRYGSERDGRPVPNWRERLVCPRCGLNNRMRAAIQIAESVLGVGRQDKIYLTEATTPLYGWFQRHYAQSVGSEHLGDETPPGTESPAGVRNEDLTRLTFDDETFDFIGCFDVLEHVPEYRRSLAECLRVLRPGGRLLFTVPFRRESPHNVVRARLRESGDVEHLLPPEYHGDPLDRDGCLAFYEFGWELLDEIRELGFARASGLLYWSLELGYLGGEQIAFAAFKGGPE